MVGPDEVYSFWFTQCSPEDWFGSNPEFDEDLRNRFGQTHEALSRGEGFLWRVTPRGRLAEIIVLDQFSRNLYRGSARAFAQDGMALALAQEAVERRIDKALPESERAFLYMPYMHAESLLVHEEAVRLFDGLANKSYLEYELGHRDCIARFGRFPFRNAALGRPSTPQEEAYVGERQGMAF